VTLTSVVVTAEDAARFGGSNFDEIKAVTGQSMEIADDGTLRIRWRDGTFHHVPEGWWVVRYAPGDIGSMSAGAFRRYFGGER
jgi:hypothetical protein